MSSIQQRKKADGEKTSDPTSSPISTQTQPTKSIKSTLLAIFTVLGLSLFVAITASFVVTNTLTFGHTIPNWRKYIPVPEKVFSETELAQYDGSDPEKPIYLAINGKIYDVSSGKRYYGKGGGYSYFAGRDAARAYITGCFATHLTHDLRGLTDQQIEGLKTWIDFYESHKTYFYVGRVHHDRISNDVPIPAPC